MIRKKRAGLIENDVSRQHLSAFVTYEKVFIPDRHCTCVLCDGQYTRGNADIMSGFAQEIKTSPGRPADIIILKLSSRKPEEVDQNPKRDNKFSWVVVYPQIVN